MNQPMKNGNYGTQQLNGTIVKWYIVVDKKGTMERLLYNKLEKTKKLIMNAK